MTKDKKITKNEINVELCAAIANAASKFKSAIFIIKGNKKVTAKSIMGLISLNMKTGETVKISASGEDESKAISAIADLLA